MLRIVLVLFLLMLCTAASAQSAVWQPAQGHVQMPLWPGAAPDLQPLPGAETVKTSDPKGKLIGGKTVVSVTNVSVPTMTVYAPTAANTGAAVVVFPGGGFEILAMDLEGTEICDWLVARGVTCVLLKYRVPSIPYRWQSNSRPHNREVPVPSLQDAQRALRLVRAHATEWSVDPHKVGVIGFSAGGYLVAEASTQYVKNWYARVDAVDEQSARPDFALAIYPGHLVDNKGVFNRNVPVTKDTPPTFLLQAEDDPVDSVDESLAYYTALKKAGVPVEMHLYAHGRHAFGLRPTSEPITHWPALAEKWLHTIGVLTTDG
jgi:acetyl esterase/lipase